MDCGCNNFSVELKNHISNLDDYRTERLLRDYTDKVVKYLKLLFIEECKKVGPVEVGGIEVSDLFELYCIKCYFLADYWIFHEHLPKIKKIFVEIVERELSEEEIEIMWYGHYIGKWYSFAPHGREEVKAIPSLKQMISDLAESIIMNPVLEDNEEQMAHEVAERNRILTLSIYVQERCVWEGLTLPSLTLAIKMVEAFACLFNDDYGNILETEGKIHNYDIVQGAIIPYIKFMGYSVCGRKSDDDSPTIEGEEIDFFEQNSAVFIKLLDASFYNYYLYSYSSLSDIRRKNYLDAVKWLFFETLQDFGPQLDDIDLNNERNLIITTFAEKADCYTHIFAIYLQGLQGKGVRIREEIASVFPLIAHLYS